MDGRPVTSMSVKATSTAPTSSPTLMGSMRKLTSLHLHDLPHVYNSSRFYFTFQRDSARPFRGSPLEVRRGEAKWDEKVLPDHPLFDSFTSKIRIRIYQYRRGLKDELIAHFIESVKPSADLAELVRSRPMLGKRKHHEVHLMVTTCNVGDEIAVDSVKNRGVDLRKPGQNTNVILSGIDTGGQLLKKSEDLDEEASSSHIDVGEVLSSVLTGLAGVWEKLQDVSELHPYLNVAYKAVDFAYKQYKDQLARDDKIRDLAVTMKKVYEFLEHAEQLNDTEHLKDDKARKDILQEITAQTRECMYFIIEYAQQPSLWLRLLGFNKTEADERIDEFNSKFTELQEEFMENAELQIAIIAAEIRKELPTLAVSFHWKFEWVRDAGYDKSKQCHPSTSINALRQITSWINGKEENRVFLLTGEAGTGKSAIAHTIVASSDQSGRLGSSFFFNRAIGSRSEPKRLFLTLGYYLTEHNSDIQSALSKKNDSLQGSMELLEQFNAFLVEPSQAYNGDRIVLIVIDALDESGTEEERHELLSILARETKQLPSNFRILVTARSEPDIIEAFHSAQAVSILHVQPDESRKEDIRKFLRFELLEQGGYTGIDMRVCDALAEKSEGFWQWASSACLYITTDPSDPDGTRARDRLEALLQHTSKSGLGGRFNSLYRFILDEVNPDLQDFKDVMSFVFSLAEPLPMSSMKKLLEASQLPDDKCPPICDILPYLGSLFSGVVDLLDADVPHLVQPLHASVREFLDEPAIHMEDSKDPVINEFYVRAAPPHSLLALASLQVLNKQLHFNICNLSTSCRRNREVPDLETRVKLSISTELSYSGRFWATHLRNSVSDDMSALHMHLRRFFMEHFLFWLEALSLMGSINVAATALSIAHHWVQSRP